MVATRFEQLQQLLTVLGDPVATGSPAEWAAAFQRLETRLPIDYLQFVTTFGHCVMDDTVQILSPFAEGGQFWEDLERERAIDRDDITVSPPDDPLTSIHAPRA